MPSYQHNGNHHSPASSHKKKHNTVDLTAKLQLTPHQQCIKYFTGNVQRFGSYLLRGPFEIVMMFIISQLLVNQFSESLILICVQEKMQTF